MSARFAGGLMAVVLLLAGGAVSSAFADEQEGDEEAEVDTGVIEIPYLEPAEVTPAEGWRIDCDGVGELDGVEVACAEGTVTLRADDYDRAWGEHVLTVPMSAGAATVDVAYRVRQGPPAAPALAASVIDVPIAVGRQTLLPLAALGILCTLCADDASIGVLETTPGLVAGVSGTHVAVRGSTPGEGVIAVEITDGAGQSVVTEVTVFVVPSSSVAGPVALHVARPSLEALSLADFAWGEGLTFSCPDDPVVAVTCGPDGDVTVSSGGDGADDSLPVQFSFRVVDDHGRQAIGSVTIDPDAAAEGGPEPVTWAKTADLGIAVAVPPDDEGDEEASVLAALDRILQEVPKP